MTTNTNAKFGPEAKAKYDKLRAIGVSAPEARARVQQSLYDKKVAGVGPARGVVLSPSRKTDTFRPNFQGRLDNRKQNVGRVKGPQRAEFLQADIVRKHARDDVLQAMTRQKDVERVFRDNPQSFRKISSSKSPEEKAHKKRLKKERRQAARDITGTDKSDWWSPIVSAGADLLPKLLPMLIGMGDYSDPDDLPLEKGETPESNSLLAAASQGSKGTTVPFMHRRNDKVRVTHREYLGDVYSTTSNFVATSFPLNPGMEETFVWCAPVANQFTDYRFLGMVADFVSQGSDYANVAGLGYVALATQYNPLQPIFVDKREMMNYEFADAVKPSRSMTHWIECKPNDLPDPEKTVRAGVIPPNADLRLYDHGNLVLAVGGNTASGSIIGMLWISYDVEFYLPKSSVSAAGVIDYYEGANTGAQAATPFGTAFVVGPRSTITVGFTGTTITFPSRLAGEFLMIFEWDGTGSGVGTFPLFTGSGGLTILATVYPVAPNGTTTYWIESRIRLDGVGPTPTFTSNTSGLILPTGVVRVTIVQIPRAPTPSEIFDCQGKNYDRKYKDFMNAVCLRQDKALGKMVSMLPPSKDEVGTTFDECLEDIGHLLVDNVPSSRTNSTHLLREVGDWALLDTVGGLSIYKGRDSKNVDLDKAYPKLFSQMWGDLTDSEFCTVCEGLYNSESPCAAGVGTILFRKRGSKFL